MNVHYHKNSMPDSLKIVNKEEILFLNIPNLQDLLSVVSELVLFKQKNMMYF